MRIAERVHLGVTYYFRRIRYFQHPDADSDPTRLIQVPNNDCDGPDTYVNRVRPWFDEPYWMFQWHESACELANYDPSAWPPLPGVCFAYWFVQQ